MTTAVPQRIVLIGSMGSGKSTVARALAARLGWRTWDNDAELERRSSATAAQLARRDGLAVEHRMELSVLADALRSPGATVVCAAASVVDHERGRALLRSEQVAWLRARPATLSRRVAGSTHRPMVGEVSAGDLQRIDAARRPRFEQVARVVVDVDDLSPDEAATRVLAALRPGPPAPADG